MNLQDWISASMWLLYGMPILCSLIPSSLSWIIHGKALIGLIVTGQIIDLIKYYTPYYGRPKGACNCNLWADNGNQEGKPAMPSGHAGLSTFFSLYYFHYIQTPWIRTMLVIYPILVMRSRYVKHCHTLPQLVAGSILGGCISKLLISYE